MKTVFLGLMMLLLAGPVLEAMTVTKEPARIVRIINGDTLTIITGGKWEEIKLLGIDMPETQLNDKVYEDALRKSTSPAAIIKRGIQGREFVKQYLRYGSQVWIEYDVQKRDRFSRLLGYVYLADGRMLNEILLRAGLAEPLWIPPNLKYTTHFKELARLAKKSAGKPKPDQS